MSRKFGQFSQSPQSHLIRGFFLFLNHSVTGSKRTFGYTWRVLPSISVYIHTIIFLSILLLSMHHVYRNLNRIRRAHIHKKQTEAPIEIGKFLFIFFFFLLLPSVLSIDIRFPSCTHVYTQHNCLFFFFLSSSHETDTHKKIH